MPAFVRFTSCWVFSSCRAAVRNWPIFAWLLAETSSRMDDWSRSCCGSPEVSSVMDEFMLPVSYALIAILATSFCSVENRPE